ncbi:MAG TPA: STAS domain-containing protein [Jatrophihabitantaceae bacterium]
MLKRPSAPLFAPKTVTGPHGAITLAAREDRVALPHWHLIGDYFRPLHEQLAALNDSRRWAAVVAEGSARMPLATAGLSLRSEGMTLTTVQRGLDYAVVAVAGDIDGPATQHVRCQIRALLDVGVRHLVVSLADVLSCDPRLGALLNRTHLRLRARNGQLELVGIPASVLPYVRVGRLPEAFAVCDSEAHAVDSAPAWARPPSG